MLASVIFISFFTLQEKQTTDPFVHAKVIDVSKLATVSPFKNACSPIRPAANLLGNIDNVLLVWGKLALLRVDSRLLLIMVLCHRIFRSLKILKYFLQKDTEGIP